MKVLRNLFLDKNQEYNIIQNQNYLFSLNLFLGMLKQMNKQMLIQKKISIPHYNYL